MKTFRLCTGRVSQLMMLLMLAVAPTAWSAHPEVSLPGSNFEIDTDANLKVDDADPSLDWANVAEDRSIDVASGSGDDSFGQGAKEDTEVPAVVSGSIPPNKSDLKTFDVYLEVIGDDRFLHLNWTRVQDPSGTTNMDFEFNQSSTLSANGVTPVRTLGDLLIQYDLSKGGTNPILSLSVWEDGSDGGTAADCEASNSLPCWTEKVDLTNAALATGSINTSAIPNGESDGIGPLSERTFGEATVDFGELIGGNTCVSFGSAYLKSRSSDSFTAALKDFIAPVPTNVSNCAGLKITKQDDADPSNPLSGAVFEVWLDDGDSVWEPGQDGQDDGMGGRTYNYTCTTSASGSCSVANILAGDYWVIETMAPAGHGLPSPDKQLVTIVAGGDEVEVTFTDPRLPASVTINKTDDADPANALQGAEFTLYTDVDESDTLNAGDTVYDSCTTNASGTCTISNILPPGKYCLDETGVPTGHTKDSSFPQCFSLALNESKTVNSVNPRQPASVTINKTDDADPANALQGAEFTLYTDVDESDTLNAGDTVYDSCTTNASGTCTISNILPPGKYCLDETGVPTGYLKDSSFPQCFSLALNESKTVNAVDPRIRGAIKVTKTRKHKAAALPAADPHEGVTFTVTDRNGVEIGSGLTNASGVYCLGNVLLSQFAPGDGKYVVTETVPLGYVADQANPQEVSVTQAATCGSGNEATVSFSNTPLTDFTISVNSQVDGGTQTDITCDNGAGSKTIPATAPDNGDGSHTASDLSPGTYVCTIVIDP